jgi:MFS family permease
LNASHHPLRNVFILAAAQTLGSSGLTVVVILGGLVAARIAPDPSLATLPFSLSIVATALSAVPAALLMQRVGRRAGLIVGTFIGAAGGLLAALAISRAAFELFCGGTLLLGSSMAFAQQNRFAAAESVPYAQVGKAVSYVLIGNLGAAVMNPQLALAAKNWLPQALYAGSFIAVSILYVATAAVLTQLRLPAPSTRRAPAPSAPVRGLFGKPQFRVAVFSAAAAYMMMTFIMTAAPISMHQIDQHDVKTTAWVIQSHVLAMYMPSLFTGYLITRWGERKVMIAGSLLLAACVAISAGGHHLMHYWSGLVLLGAGWNLLFVSGTTLLAKAVDENDRHRAQAINDFTVFGSQACASLLAGVAVLHIGWQALNLAILPLLVAVTLTANRLKTDAAEAQPAAASVPGTSP